MLIDNTQAAEIWTSLKIGKLINGNKQASDFYHSLSIDEQISVIEDVLDQDFKVFALPIQNLINSVYNPKDLPILNENKRTNLKLNREKYYSSEFKQLWSRINRKTYYTVDFDDEDIINKSINLINKNLTVTTLKANIIEGNMQANDKGTTFSVEQKTIINIKNPINNVKYDLIGEIAQNVGLLRKTIG
ncbi:hypothetical protein [Staphylococcus hominis]|uniref:hypothetical protein n=1 Tax=Staphylococcus hominis TaxID=1290 RepID=UPI0039B513E5